MDENTGEHLPPGGVRTLLRDLGGAGEHVAPLAETWNGVIRVQKIDGSDLQARLWLRGGQVYSADLTGFTPPLATRLVSAGCLSEEEARDLEATVEADHVGSVAVSRYAIDRAIVEELHREVTLAVVSHLYEWEDALWLVEKSDTYPGYVTSPMPLLLVVSAVDERIGQWRAVSRAHPRAVRPAAKPQPGPAWIEKTGQEVTPEMAALLSRVDGRTSVARIANACGFTRFEMARLLQQAIAEGLLVFPPPTQPAPAGATGLSEEAPQEAPDSDISGGGVPELLDSADEGELSDLAGENSGDNDGDGDLETDGALNTIRAAELLCSEALAHAQEATRLAEQAQAMIRALTDENDQKRVSDTD